MNAKKRSEVNAGRRGRPAHVISEAAARTDLARIGARIRRLRLAAQIATVQEAALAAEVPYSRWSDWELGRAAPTCWDLPVILRTLGCELGDVIPEGD